MAKYARKIDRTESTFVGVLADMITRDMKSGDESSFKEHLSHNDGPTGALLVMSVVERLGKSGRDDLALRATQIVEDLVDGR